MIGIAILVLYVLGVIVGLMIIGYSDKSKSKKDDDMCVVIMWPLFLLLFCVIGIPQIFIHAGEWLRKRVNDDN